MPIAEAHVGTDRAARYLDQLCQHASRAHRMRHGHAAHTGQVRVERAEGRAVLDFGWGRCTVAVAPAGLRLVAESADGAGLARVQQIIGNDIERFGGRERLAVDWRPVDGAPVDGAGRE